MPIGAGLCPAGASPAGYGVPDRVGPPNAVALPHPVTGLPQGGRYLDPKTGDYVFTSDGRLQGMANVQQLVLLALRTTIGSSSLPTMGNAIARITEKGPDFQRQLATVIADAFAPIVNQKLARLDAVRVLDTPNPDGAFAYVEWTDLTTQTPQTTQI